ncbi:CpaE family protein [Phenylobacterium sp.]|uniref:AAA family ATPase n=1 Tax=Phenylobacterium sp. TaxID=1871053 RepID=UPI0035B35DB9
MKPQQGHDPFDPDFDADDEFAPADNAWREPPPAAAADPLGADPLAGVPAPAAGSDPFADLPPSRKPDPIEQILLETGGDHDEDPFGLDAPPPRAEANPVHDMIAGAEAAFGEASLPRITVHIFCVSAETAEIAEKAAGDRRMERATVVVRTGGLAAAVEIYQNQATPSLVMVESADPGVQLLGLLDRLAEVCDPGTKVVVIGGANDIALYRELMRRGVSEYLVPPLNPLLIVRTATSLYADPSAPFVGRQIAFCGAKGGAGASTIAHNVAYSITERLQTGAVLVDLDLPFGTAGLDFNQDPLQGVADALSQPDRLDSVLMDRMMARCTERLSLFAAPATLDGDYDISTEAFEEVTQKIRSAAPFVVLDLPHVWTAWKRKILLSSDDLVIVATPDLASLRNAKNMIDLVRRARPNDAPPRLVLNQVGVPGRPEIPVKDFGEALGLTPALCLPFDPKLFGQAANNGQMIAEVGPKSRSAEGLDHLAQQIARREPPAVQKTSLLSSLFKKK